MKNILLKIKYYLNLMVYSLLFKIGFKKKLLKNRYGEHILVFHGIDKKGETKYNSRFISQKYFEELIMHFSKNYNLISLDDFYAKKFKENTLNIAITFDDGYENNYKYAIPVLKKHHVPVTFFITTIPEKYNFLWADFIDLVSVINKKNSVSFQGNVYVKKKNEFVFKNTSLKQKCKYLEFDQIEKLFDIFKDEWNFIKQNDFTDYYKLMSKEQIIEINNNSLFNIGSHGVYHTNLAVINIDNAKKEILNSKEYLEKICTTTYNTFAFPFGTSTNELIDYCKTLELDKILLVDYQNEKDKLDGKLKNRFGINPYISKELQLLFLLKGSYA